MKNYDQTEIEYAKAFKEVYVILENAEEKLLEKIPKDFINLVEENMDKDYEITMDLLDEKGLLPKAEAIIAIIYRDFLAEESDLKDNNVSSKVNYSDILRKNYEKNKVVTAQMTIDPQETKEINIEMYKKWYVKLFDKIKMFFIKK